VTPRFLLDTGPLVAAMIPGDRWHGWARQQLEALRGPFGTCEAVLTEAMHLLARRGNAQDLLLQLFEDEVGMVLPLASELPSVRTLSRRYRSVPMDFADACLVRLSELHPRLPLVTLDSDFHVYRRNRTQRLPLISP
jgi:uncharacterized protein